MNILPIVNENDPVSTTDIELDDNYPLALTVANITGADFIVIKSPDNGKYDIVAGNNQPVIHAEDEISLQEGIEDLCSRDVRMASHPREIVFPASMEMIYSR